MEVMNTFWWMEIWLKSWLKMPPQSKLQHWQQQPPPLQWHKIQPKHAMQYAQAVQVSSNAYIATSVRVRPWPLLFLWRLGVPLWLVSTTSQGGGNNFNDEDGSETRIISILAAAASAPFCMPLQPSGTTTTTSAKTRTNSIGGTTTMAGTLQPVEPLKWQEPLQPVDPQWQPAPQQWQELESSLMAWAMSGWMLISWMTGMRPAK